MAIIVFDGFEKYAALADMQSRRKALNWSDYNDGDGGALSFITGFGGFGFAATFTTGVSGTQIGASINQNFSAVNYGVQMLITNPAGSQGFFDFCAMDYTAGVPQMTFRLLVASGTILVYLGDANSPGNNPIAATPPNAAAPFMPLKYELLINIGSSGSYNFSVNGTSVISATGVNTKNTANAWTNGFRMRSGVLSGTGGPFFVIDNFCCNDTTSGPGTFPFNGFAGDVAVRTLRTTGNISVAWIPFSGTNWQEVNAIQFVGDAAYNYTMTNAATDQFSFGSLPADVSTVFAVQVTGAYRKEDSGNQRIQQFLVSGSATATLSSQDLALSYGYYTDLQVLDPNTAATWTPAAVNALNGGYTLLTS